MAELACGSSDLQASLSTQCCGCLTPALPLEGPRDGGKDAEGGWGTGPSLRSALGAAGDSEGHKQGGR